MVTPGTAIGEAITQARAQRQPERTRAALLRAAFEEIYHAGFQGTGLDRILAKANVTKGALYHHFDGKEALGYAILDEIIAQLTDQKWIHPLAEGGNPIDTLIRIVQGTSLLPEHVRDGCPLNNLSQEMSPLDEGFRNRVARIFKQWREAMIQALDRGKSRGQVQSDLDVQETANFLIAMYEGYVSLAKNAQDPEVLRSGVSMMTRYLETLRA